MGLLFFYLSLALFVSFMCSILEAVLLSTTSSYIASLDDNKKVSGKHAEDIDTEFHIDFSPYIGTAWDAPVDTSIDKEAVQQLAEKITP